MVLVLTKYISVAMGISFTYQHFDSHITVSARRPMQFISLPVLTVLSCDILHFISPYSGCELILNCRQQRHEF